MKPVLQVTGTQARGVVRGSTAAGSTIEAINLSTIPTKRLHQTDTFDLTVANDDGKFSGTMEMRAGDFLRVRARTKGGARSSWVTIRAQGLGKDTRNAEVELLRIGLKAAGKGRVDVSNINSSRPISEPGAQLMFVNERTKERTLVVLDDEGTFEKGTLIDGVPGDVFSIRASDGVNNKSFAQQVGTVKVPGGRRLDGGVDLPDPKLHKDDRSKKGEPLYEVARLLGKLVDAGGADPEDVVQGNIGDCYVPSAAASLADCDDELFGRIMKDNKDGTVSVTFKEWNDDTGRYKKKVEKVDRDVYVRAVGGPLYGTDDGTQDQKRMEAWFAIFEKAYAQFCGGFDVIGNGGSSADVFQAVLGRDALEVDIHERKPDAFFDLVVEKKDAGLPVSLGTYGDRAARRYTNSGVFTDHSYSVLDHKTLKDGTRMLLVRNPWGESEPYPGDRSDDGKFWMKAETAARLFRTVYSVV